MMASMFLILAACNSATENVTVHTGEEGKYMSGEEAEITFEKKVHDFGTLTAGEQVICYYPYTNSGDAPLVISGIRAGCGCTVADWSGEPLETGEKATIKVRFDSGGKHGVQKNSLTVLSNASNPRIKLTLKAVVKK